MVYILPLQIQTIEGALFEAYLKWNFCNLLYPTNLCGFDPGLEAGSRYAILSNLVISLVPYVSKGAMGAYMTGPQI